MMEVGSFCEMSECMYQATWLHIQQETSLNLHK
jgi:hypothetical protein